MRYFDPAFVDGDQAYAYEVDAPGLTDIGVTVTENPVVGELLGPKGEVLRQVRERRPIGYAHGR